MKKPVDGMTDEELDLKIAKLKASGVIRPESPVEKFVGGEGSVQVIESNDTKSGIKPITTRKHRRIKSDTG